MRAALTAAEGPLSGSLCDQWLDEYRPYHRAVQDLITCNGILAPMGKPFAWLADLAQHLEMHRRANNRSMQVQGLVLVLLPELRQQLMQACL